MNAPILSVPSFDLKNARSLPGYWYLATPYTRYALGIEEAFRAASMATADLIRLGVSVFSPIAHTHPVGIYGSIDPYDVDFWVKVDAPLMRAASGLIVFTMPGWAESKGVTHERIAFDNENKPIEFLAPEELRALLASEGILPLPDEVAFG